MKTKPFLYEIRIEPTNKCNCQCSICPREKMTRNIESMSFGLYRKILDNAIICGAKRLSFCGFGESLLDKGLPCKMEYARRIYPKLQIVIGTHASYLEKEIIAKLNFNAVRFSFTDDNINKRYEINKDVKKKYERRSCEIVLTTAKSSKNDIDNFVNYWLKFVPYVSVWKAHNWCNGRNYRIVEKQIASCDRHKRDTIEVMSNGLVRTCCWDYNGDQILGDLKKQNIEEIYFGKKYNEFREAHESGILNHFPQCSICDQRNEYKNSLIFSSRATAHEGYSNSTLLKIG